MFAGCVLDWQNRVCHKFCGHEGSNRNEVLNEVALEAHNGEDKEGEQIEEEDQILSALRSKGITVLTGVLICLIVLIVVVIGTFYAACSVKHPKMNRNKVEPENLLGMTKHII